GLPFLEAVRQFRKDVGRENVIYVHLTLVPYMQAASELKTKATQHSVKELRAIGIQPDVLLCRTDRYLPPGIKSKIALFCDVEQKDSYKSLVEALAHGGIANEARVDVQWVDAEHIERDGAEAQFTGVHGILVPGGFGDRGILGKIEAVRYARERRVPYLGICL